MGFAPPRALFVPAGTAAAVVASEVRHPDPQLDARRWAHLAERSPESRAEALRALVAAGVYTHIENRIVVVRIVRDGVRSLAAIVAQGETGADARTPNATTAGTPVGTAVELRVSIASAALEEALIAATRTRPVFHGTPPDGSTLSGFIPEDEDAILSALRVEVEAGGEITPTGPNGAAGSTASGGSTASAGSTGAAGAMGTAAQNGVEPASAGSARVLAVFAGTPGTIPPGLVVVG